MALDPTTAGAPGNYAVKGDHNGSIAINTVTVMNDALTGKVTLDLLPTTTVFSAVEANANAGFSAQANFYKDATLRFTTGVLAGESQPITDYVFDEGTGIATFTTDPFTAAPVDTNAFEILKAATGRVILTFAEPLPDDRFTLTVNDSVRDPVGNRLDGESNADEPNAAPTFPSGDGQSGGDFVARFTVDSRPEIGVWSGGSVYLDTNRNYVFDTEGKDNDDTNRDLVYALGFTTDNIFAGNFAAPGLPADGFGKLAAYGFANGRFRWLIDTTNDGVPNRVVSSPNNINGLPVAGDFDKDPANGDEMGVFTGAVWFLYDTNFGLLQRVNSAI